MLAWVLSACGLDGTQQGQGPGGKVSGGKRAGTPCYQIWREMESEILGKSLQPAWGKVCQDVSEGLDEQAFPHPPPHLDGGPGACAESVVRAASGPSPQGSGRFQGQSWRSGEMLSVRPSTGQGRPACLGGQQRQLQDLRSPPSKSLPGAQKGPPRQGDSTWDQRPRPSTRPAEGPGRGACSCRGGRDLSAQDICASGPPMAPPQP